VLPDTEIVSNDCLTENELRILALNVGVIQLRDMVELALACQPECYSGNPGRFEGFKFALFSVTTEILQRRR